MFRFLKDAEKSWESFCNNRTPLLCSIYESYIRNTYLIGENGISEVQLPSSMGCSSHMVIGIRERALARNIISAAPSASFTGRFVILMPFRTPCSTGFRYYFKKPCRCAASEGHIKRGSLLCVINATFDIGPSAT
ncbi:hypothetical protein FEM48_Zijuj12G0107200 [Ziziphus jujuba var. spinosa]|uniref:Uncharacterized protein n=1 Tax=Ziziphus jujuba var. spinosa TaxID=714518 RepID=A0A978UCV0_ZIZJJ|nr:hypothetical protein FEM48_Zijuj12G0107200 [Ziziphus jujuba var. spinosa]